MTSFTIDRIVPSRIEAHVDVHVRYDGGAMVLTFPDGYPQGTLLTQVRVEVRARLQGQDKTARWTSLIGKHDL